MRTHASGDRYISREIAEHGVWEPLESRVFAQLVKPGSIVLDLGANIGYYTVLAGLCAGPRGQVYAFEPESHNVALLRENVALNDLGNVTVAEAAAWSVSNAGELYLSADNKGDHRAYDGGNGAGSVPVQRVALDDWFADRERRIDVVKMDTQGSELRILQGMRGLLDANRGRMRLIVEFWPHGLEGAGDSAAALVELLRGYDFTLSKVDETLTQAQPTEWDRLLEEARTIYHPSTRHYTNLLLVPRS
jgi:FkbM family methyltransferase